MALRCFGRQHPDLCRLACDEGGAAAVEFALVLPLLALLIVGVVDVSRLVVQTIQVRAAAQAGADYALKNGWNAGGVANAVQVATTLSVTPTATLLTRCVSGATLAASAGPLCPSGGTPGAFVSISAEAPFAALANWPGLPMPTKVTGQALVRVQ